jgi:hypothetical protein
LKGPIKILSHYRENDALTNMNKRMCRFICPWKSVEGIKKGDTVYLLPEGFTLEVLDVFPPGEEQSAAAVLKTVGPQLPSLKKGSVLVHGALDLDLKKYLPPYLRTMLITLETDFQGILDIYHLGHSEKKEGYRALSRLELLILCDDRICCSPAKYRELVDCILGNKRKGDKIYLQEVREKLGYTRRFLIPLFKKMRLDGIIEETEDGRIVNR